jgi:hypothetical protein
MSTRSRIGIQLSDESILSVYCHSDGYPEFNGAKLVENFNSYDKVSELIDGGDISCLWTNKSWGNWRLPTYGPLYFTSRGEEYNPPRLDSNLEEYLSKGEEYAYIFKDGEWVCYNTRSWDEKYLQQMDIPVAVEA